MELLYIIILFGAEIYCSHECNIIYIESTCMDPLLEYFCVAEGFLVEYMLDNPCDSFH